MEPLSANDPHAVGEFQLRARLGAGGMGRVYLAFSPAGRAVAIKVVHPELARDPEFRQRFAREVAAARAVSGMYTAPVVAAGLDDESPWLATAYVPGPSLADVVGRHGPLPEPAVWRLAAGLAEALRVVHACGLVHRDLKPANVLLATDGPHVIDFGISRAYEGTSVTAAGMVVGTPGYMSPEQAEGAQAGPASDVFSLGCVLAYAVTGNAPFGDGSAASVLYRVVTGQPDLTGVPGRLRDVISACMMKNPAQRPGLTAMGTMIAQAGPPVTATLTSFWPPPVAEIIRAAQAAPAPAGPAPASPVQAVPGQNGMVQDGYHAMATASIAARPPGAAPPFGGTEAAFGVAGAPTYGAAAPMPPGTPATPAAAGTSAGPGSWPPGSSATPWPQPAPGDVMSRYTPAPQRPWQPTPVLVAAWLMYSGAAASLVGMLVDLSVINRLRTDYLNHHPLLVNHANTVAGAEDLGVIVGSVISIGLWLWLASACKKGHGWARTVGTVLLGIDTVGLIVTIGRPGIPGTKAIHVLVWLIGLVTVIFLWRRQSSEYFANRR
jgi:tRNA A-37 threonylcarbamoyl transferase component Bud32